MSGSGATCFALYDTLEARDAAAAAISAIRTGGPCAGHCGERLATLRNHSPRADRTGASIVCIADHASNHVPAGHRPRHLRALCCTNTSRSISAPRPSPNCLARDHAIPAHIAAVSRLVCDLNREEDRARPRPRQPATGTRSPAMSVPTAKRGSTASTAPIMPRWSSGWTAAEPALILSLHSFTPRLAASRDEPRPWEVGVLYNTDDRAARIAIPLLAAEGLNVGDNLPYSGRDAQLHDEPPCRGTRAALSRRRTAAGPCPDRRRSRPLGRAAGRHNAKGCAGAHLKAGDVSQIACHRKSYVAYLRQVQASQPPRFGRAGARAAPLVLLRDGHDRGRDRAAVRRRGQRGQRQRAVQHHARTRRPMSAAKA